MEESTHSVRLFRGYTAIMWWASIFAFVLCIIVLATPGWAKSGQTHFGLWRTCSPDPIGCVKITSPPAWLEASQAMVCLSFIASVVATATVTIYMFLHSVNKSNVLRVFTVASVASAFFMFLGFVVFASKASNTDLYYSFVLAVVNFLFFCTTAVAGGLQMKHVGAGLLPTV
ncbi:hypothetical protein LSAT2_018221 [Lamellibrachia satsuma]|nr:hypothetical protein LSAT2_018221 [Lamellibrachia satsuma]